VKLITPGGATQAGGSETGPGVVYQVLIYDMGWGGGIPISDEGMNASMRVTVTTGACASRICTGPESVAEMT